MATSRQELFDIIHLKIVKEGEEKRKQEIYHIANDIIG